MVGIDSVDFVWSMHMETTQAHAEASTTGSSLPPVKKQKLLLKLESNVLAGFGGQGDGSAAAVVAARPVLAAAPANDGAESSSDSVQDPFSDVSSSEEPDGGGGLRS